MGKGYQFGTFKGVFTPSILRILAAGAVDYRKIVGLRGGGYE